jgi:phosphoribosyl-AMP cyclohydrolase
VAIRTLGRYADPQWNSLVYPVGSVRNVTVTPPTIPNFTGPDGLVTAVAQELATGEVLMVAHMNREAWEETLASGQAVYFSRSRGKLWRKGEQSGNVQHVRSVRVDCDGDAVLLLVDQVGGAACHEGYSSCFFREATPDGLKVIAERVFDPAAVYGRPGEPSKQP